METETIGVGIITHNRPNQLMRLYGSLPMEDINKLIIVNDGNDYPIFDLIPDNYVWHTGGNCGVASAKNIALNKLNECDHIFLIEDDIYIKDFRVFRKYIESSKVSGIQHFNFSQHGMMNKSWPEGTPNPRLLIDFDTLKIPLYPHCVGAFSYYSKLCISEIGNMCNEYYNACEHVDHTLQIINKGMHPPFWHFADIENSNEFLGDEEWSLQQSTISSKNDHSAIVRAADAVFVSRHGILPGQIPDSTTEDVIKALKQIKKNYV